MISVRTLKTPSRPGDETIPTVSIEKLVDLVHVVASLTPRLQVKMLASTAMAGGKISTAKALTADNKHRMLRSEIRKEASVAMATTTADRKTLAGTPVMVGKIWVNKTRFTPPTRKDSDRMVAGVRQTLTAGSLWAGTTTTGAAAVSRETRRVSGPAAGTMTMRGRVAGLTGTRTREVSRLRL